MPNIFLIDFGSTYTKVTVVDPEKEHIVGTAKAFTTVQTDVQEGLEQAVNQLEEERGTVNCDLKRACSSAAGGLRMVTVGLVPDLTAEAAKMAALSAGAKVMKVFSYDLNEAEAEQINNLQPDIILLTGGTDGGNKEVILHNAEAIAGIDGDFPVVVAGNKSVSERVITILKHSGKETLLCENVMPRFNVLNIEPARECIRNVFLKKIIHAKGITKIQNLIEGFALDE